MLDLATTLNFFKYHPGFHHAYEDADECYVVVITSTDGMWDRMKFQLTMLGREDQGAQLLTSSTEVEVKTVMHVTNIRNNIAEAKMNFGMINGEEVNHCNSWGQFLRYKPRAPSYLKKYPKTIKIYPKIPKIIVLKNHAKYT